MEKWRKECEEVASHWETYISKEELDLWNCADELAAILAEPVEVSEELTPLSFVTEMWPPDQGGMRSYMPRGVKVTHKPTGITVTCEHERSQHKNRDTAIRALRAAIKEPGQ